MNGYKAFPGLKVVAAILLIVLIPLFSYQKKLFSMSFINCEQFKKISARPPCLAAAKRKGNTTTNAKIEEIYKHDSGKKKRLPDALIIGTTKCGTSALYHYLAIHPDIVRAEGEVKFFKSSENYKKGLSWYKNQMPESEPSQLTIEKTPTYIMYPERLKASLPNMTKFIWTVCDPVERALSEYQHRLYMNTPNYHVDGSFRDMTTKKRGNELHAKMNSTLISQGRYSVLLKNWLKYFPMETLFIIDGNRLKTDLLEELQELENFLGLPPFINETHFVKNELGFYCAKSEGCLGGGKGIQKHPKMDLDVENTLRQYFKPYNKQFFSLIGRKLNWKDTIDEL